MLWRPAVPLRTGRPGSATPAAPAGAEGATLRPGPGDPVVVIGGGEPITYTEVDFRTIGGSKFA